MKSLKIFAMACLAMLSVETIAQTDKATTRRIVDEKTYTFVATSAAPLNASDINNVMSKMAGVSNAGNINLTGSNYDLRLTKDSVVAYLPFFGRSYTAPVNNTESGFKFTSKDFTYNVTKRKRGGWDIKIGTKDVQDRPQMTLSISESGYATLSMVSNNKQSITYNGYLAENKDKN